MEIIQNLEKMWGPNAVYCQSSVEKNTISIEAGKDALIKLAVDLLKMADKKYYEGMHQHIDELNLLEEPSIPIINTRNDKRAKS